MLFRHMYVCMQMIMDVYRSVSFLVHHGSFWGFLVTRVATCCCNSSQCWHVVFVLAWVQNVQNFDQMRGKQINMHLSFAWYHALYPTEPHIREHLIDTVCLFGHKHSNFSNTSVNIYYELANLCGMYIWHSEQGQKCRRSDGLCLGTIMASHGAAPPF